MENRVVLTARDLDGFLSDQDMKHIELMHTYYNEAIKLFRILSATTYEHRITQAKREMIDLYDRMGKHMIEMIGSEQSIHVYSFNTPRESHGEASRLIAKLRDPRTEHHEFVYYIQRAYELLFNLTFMEHPQQKKNYLITETPVKMPIQNFAVHKIPDVDELIEHTVMCVMLRGALLPSMIMSKEIQEYSSTRFVPPFALFKIQRDDSKKESNMEYILDLDRSYFNLEALDGKDLVFADPMNATGGSLVTIVTYLTSQGVKPRSVKFVNVISALKGSLRIVRAIEHAEVFTLWMDPVLNEQAYILPGLGDAGDRINGPDIDESPRNIIQLVADYGSTIANLYRDQIRKMEETVLGL